MSLSIFEELKSSGADILFRIKEHLGKGRYPPLSYFINSLFYFFVLPTQLNATLINTSVFLIILLFSLYKIGEVIKNEYLGILSCIIILFYPAVFTETKIYMLDFPLLAMTSLSMYFLIKSENLKNRQYVFLFVISAAIGMFIKINFLIFILAPFVFSVFEGIKNKTIGIKFLPFLFISLIIGGLIYFVSLPDYSKNLVRHWQAIIFKDSCVVTTWYPPHLHDMPFLLHKIRGMLWYVWGFINWQGGFLYLLFFVGGLFKFVRSKNVFKKFIFVWLGGGYLILSWIIYGIDMDMEVTAIRYSMPLLIPISLVSAYGILDIKNRLRQKLLVSSILIYGVTNTAFLSYPIFKKPIILRINIAQDKYHLLPSYINIFSTQPLFISGSNWHSHPQDKTILYKKIEGMFFDIAKFYKGGKINVVILSDNPYLHHFNYLAFKLNKDINFICDYSRAFGELKKKGLSHDDLIKADFVIEVKGGFKAEINLLKYIEVLEETFQKKKEKFEFLEEIKTEEFTLYLYKRKKA